jgi:predicted regulator of Ras-like GTPase activity (Roadblock/LC7/MglB family)
MDAAQALADLTEISSQIQAAVIFDGEGGLLASTLADSARGERMVRSARELLEAGGRVRRQGKQRLAQIEAATLDGSVFVVREGERAIAAATSAEPTVGLVFYDLKSCLRAVAAGDEPKPKPKRASRKKAEAPAPEAEADPEDHGAA